MPPTDNTLHAQLRALVAGPPTDECLLFPGFVAESGYGSLKIDGKTRGAHQVAWELHNQQAVPVGMFVLHSCLKTRSCVNWRHLRIGTAQDNADDRNRDGMTSSGDNHYARTNPERLARGDAHGSRLHPGALPRGDEHHARTHPERLARGEDAGMAKLDDDKVREIRARLARGERQVDLARAFGVNQPTISCIKRRATWKHIP